MNEDGNYELGATAYYGLPLNQKKSLWLSFDINGKYFHSVDMQHSTDQEQHRSIVHTRQMVGQTKLRYSFSSAEIGYTFQTDLRNIDTNSQPTTTVTDLSNQLSFNCVLPWHINLTASCNIITRLGYIDKTINRSVVLCGLSASRELGPFIFALTANDLFHHNDRLTCVLNEQGRTETINRKYLPSYILFHAYYRWEIAKKKTL